MKSTLIALAVASTAMMAAPVLAQTRPAGQPTVATTLPDAFGTQSPATPRPNARPDTQAATRPATRSAVNSTTAQAASPAVRPATPANATPQSPARAETALRTVIAGLKSGDLDYGTFTNDLAQQVQDQADNIGSLLTQFGPLKTINHKGQPQGANLFEVEFDKQKTEWIIGFDNNGRIAALLFRPAEAQD